MAHRLSPGLGRSHGFIGFMLPESAWRTGDSGSRLHQAGAARLFAKQADSCDTRTRLNGMKKNATNTAPIESSVTDWMREQGEVEAQDTATVDSRLKFGLLLSIGCNDFSNQTTPGRIRFRRAAQHAGPGNWPRSRPLVAKEEPAFLLLLKHDRLRETSASPARAGSRRWQGLF